MYNEKGREITSTTRAHERRRQLRHMEELEDPAFKSRLRPTVWPSLHKIETVSRLIMTLVRIAMFPHSGPCRSQN